MNEHLDGEQELIVVDNASTDSPGGGGGVMEGTRSGSSASTRTSASAPPRTRGVEAAAGAGRPSCSTPTPSCSTTGSTGSPTRRGELGGARRPAGAQPRPHDPAVGERARGRRLAVGAGAGPRRRSSRRRCARAPSPTGSSAGVRSTWLTGACIAGADRRSCAGSARSTRRCTCSARTSTSACAPRPPGSRSWFDPRAVTGRPPWPGLVDARLRLARGLAADRHPELARRGAPRLRRRGASGSAGARCGSTCACG